MISTTLFSRPKRLWFFLAGFHLFISILIGAIGRSPWLSSMHNDHGVWNFAVDGNGYQTEILHLKTTIQDQGWSAWARQSAWFHDKVYSISYYFFGDRIISAILINTPLYLLSLWLVFLIGRTLFGQTAGTAAMIFLAILPSYLVQSTQLLRDSFLIPGQLAFIYAIIKLLGYRLTWRQTLSGILIGILGYVAIWALKYYLTPFYVLLTVLAFLLSLLMYLKLRSIRPYQCTALLLLIVLFSFGYRAINLYNVYVNPISPSSDSNSSHILKTKQFSNSSVSENICLPPNLRPTPKEIHLEKFSKQPLLCRFPFAVYLVSQLDNISILRDNFRQSYYRSTSNIDTDIGFANYSDMVRYLPRALWIGLMAPFPNLWFERGAQTGRIGRIVSGFEMCLMYLVIFLAGRAVWKNRKNPIVWLMTIFIFYGVAIDALIITNIGALYRFRYVYWILIAILASGNLRPFQPNDQHGFRE